MHHAKEEGIIFDLLTNPVEILTDENAWVCGMKCIRMELGEPDASGRRRPVEVPVPSHDRRFAVCPERFHQIASRQIFIRGKDNVCL